MQQPHLGSQVRGSGLSPVATAGPFSDSSIQGPSTAPGPQGWSRFLALQHRRGQDLRHARHVVSSPHLRGSGATLRSGRAPLQTAPDLESWTRGLRDRPAPPRATFVLSCSTLDSLGGFFPHGPVLSFSPSTARAVF
ncbi:hypothetical protein NDU88_004679 [Pleurodeles waltl]|uniref:Uncharacterized protein n=1 Tax=Pleurodeles waltl TaxID=8319 RepID=A0AAV7RK83_PLEWA|nr:hypothetical protein NDU88_004679 [Pleurodeles waltl]